MISVVQYLGGSVSLGSAYPLLGKHRMGSQGLKIPQTKTLFAISRACLFAVHDTPPPQAFAPVSSWRKQATG
jgi:hypothetical protein